MAIGLEKSGRKPLRIKKYFVLLSICVLTGIFANWEYDETRKKLDKVFFEDVQVMYKYYTLSKDRGLIAKSEYSEMEFEADPIHKFLMLSEDRPGKKMNACQLFIFISIGTGTLAALVIIIKSSRYFIKSENTTR